MICVDGVGGAAAGSVIKENLDFLYGAGELVGLDWFIVGGLWPLPAAMLRNKRSKPNTKPTRQTKRMNKQKSNQMNQFVE